MPVRDDLGTRMKEYYEQVPKYRLFRRTPVAIRIDGKAFHTFTRGFKKPFDEVLGNSMVATMEYLCKNIQGCVFGYTQSDEISLLLIDYQKLNSSAWFDYEIQKICSIAASMATMAFNEAFQKEVHKFHNEHCRVDEHLGYCTNHWDSEENEKLYGIYCKKLRTALFDARCFNIPKEEACNLIYWRQLDATRNSIQMVGQANFSHKELQGKSCNVIQDMLHEQRDINWNDFPTRWKRGVACRRFPTDLKLEEVREEKEWGEPDVYMKATQLYEWKVDYEMPILKNEGRKYVDEVIFVGE